MTTAWAGRTDDSVIREYVAFDFDDFVDASAFYAWLDAISDELAERGVSGVAQAADTAAHIARIAASHKAVQDLIDESAHPDCKGCFDYTLAHNHGEAS